MINKVLQEIEDSKGPINLNELERKLGIERSALDGMLKFLIQSGHLVPENFPVNQDPGSACSCNRANCIPY